MSDGLHAYLGILARNTMLGGNENDVAKYLLTQRLEAMRQDDYHEKTKVPGDDDA